MKCPNCGADNLGAAKFCKKCGAKLDSKSIAHAPVTNKNNVNSVNSVNSVQESDKNKNIIIICVAAIICAVIVAGAFIYINGMNNDDSTVVEVPNEPPAIEILGGSFSTGSSLSDKTYAKIYLGKEHAGEKVKITAVWSRDGYNLNNGNILTRTIDANGYVSFNSLDAFTEFPDYAVVKLYDLNGNLVDTQDVSLSPSSGTQTF